jgi:hypothetical protein
LGKLLETFEITPLSTCSKCNNFIAETEGQYHCYWCKVSFCEGCVEQALILPGREKLFHKEHNLLYFKTKNPENLMELDLYKLGKNLVASACDEDLIFLHPAICNGKCKSGLKKNSSRFICISCRPGTYHGDGFCDYCQKCINSLRNPSDEKHLEVKEATPEHDHENHVYLRVVFDVKDYKNY